MIEVELKCELRPELLPRLDEKPGAMQFDGTVHNVDIYYDTQKFDFLQQAVFVRIRNHCHLEFKFNEKMDREHGQSTERTFPLLPDIEEAAKMNALFTRFLPGWQAAPTVEGVIRQNGLIELVRIDNRREAYSGNGIFVSVDHVEGLGNFLEIETRSEEGTDTSHAQALLQDFVQGLNVKHIKVGYVELWLHLHNPEAYMLGQYHL